MHESLKKIVTIAARFLKKEDDAILNSIKNNQIAYKNKSGGLLRINNERYYQFIIAKGLIAEYEYPIEIEKNTYDLVVLDGNRYKTVVEMKRWMSSTGKSEIDGIKVDINNKLLPSDSERALMLIFSANPSSISIQENVSWLSEKLNIKYDSNKWHVESFDTLSANGESTVFWIAGIEIK
ncbi:MAG: hypothetical protein KAZ02_03505 [Acinetobacter sp.]|nr:hypothetical protein [Acinetobacter sp.]